MTKKSACRTKRPPSIRGGRGNFYLLLCLLFSFFTLYLSPPAFAEPADGTEAYDAEFVQVSLDQRETISGKALMLFAYAVIFGLLLLYVASLHRRQKALEKAALDLKRRIEMTR